MFTPYVCKDRPGVVHLAYPKSGGQGRYHDYHDDYEGLVDQTLCGESNYMDVQPADTLVTCLMCLSVHFKAQQDEAAYYRDIR
jgi:hypothetical protein